MGRTCGFRLSATDVCAILACALATSLAWPLAGEFALIAPLALGHFFLFCNVFRVRRSFELIWAGCFIANFFIWISLSQDGSINLFGLLAVQLPITILMILLEMRSDRYHGILCRRINPQIEHYLNGEIG